MNTDFERSPDGVANRAVFFEVDYVAYHESRFTNRRGTPADTLFWENIFRKFRPDVRVKFLPTGSKSDTLDLYNSVSGLEESDSIFLLDRDLDDIFGNHVDNDKVIYTFGYSFENDIISSESFVSVCYNLTASMTLVANAQAIWDAELDEESSSLHRLAQFQIETSKRGLPTLAVHNAYKICSPATNHMGVRLDRQKLIGIISGYRATGGEIIYDRDRTVVRSRRCVVQGHFLLDFLYQSLLRCIKASDLDAYLNKKGFYGALISATFHPFSGAIEDEVSDYYVDRLSEL